MGQQGARYREQVILVLKDAATGKVECRYECDPNIVTNWGDQYYAERGAAQTPAITFNVGQMVVAASFTKAASVHGKTARFSFFARVHSSYSGRKTFDSGYPKTADTDTDNTGRTIDAVTYKRTYTTSQANTMIRAIGVCRRNAVTTSGAAASNRLLAYKTLNSAQQVTKTSSQTLVVYVNHTFLGI